MTRKKYRETAKSLIAKGQPEKAITLLLGSDLTVEEKNELITISGRFQQLNRERRKNIIPNDEARIQREKIINAFIELDIMRSESAPSELVYAQKKPSRNFLIAFFGILIVALLVWIVSKGNGEIGNSPPSYAELITQGKEFVIIMSDTIGNLDKGREYTVRYNEEEESYHVSGYHRASRSVRSYVSKGGNPKDRQINLWGGIHTFESDGTIYKRGGQVGRIARFSD